MIIDVTCPVTLNPMFVFDLEMPLRDVIDAHMQMFHKDWAKVGGLYYIPLGSIDCCACGENHKNLQTLNLHMRKFHKDYEKIESAVWRKIKEVA